MSKFVLLLLADTLTMVTGVGVVGPAAQPAQHEQRRAHLGGWQQPRGLATARADAAARSHRRTCTKRYDHTGFTPRKK